MVSLFRVEFESTHVLVMLRSDVRGNLNLVGGIAGLVWSEAVRVDNASSLHLELDRAVEGKVEVEAVLVVRDGADGGDDELAITGDVGSHVSEVGVLVQDTGVLLADQTSEMFTFLLRATDTTYWMQMADLMVSMPPARVTNSASR
jgi:hypothetical protein